MDKTNQITTNGQRMNNNMPRHIEIIIDGNRRWAIANNLPSFMGHKIGIENIQNIIKYSLKLGIEIVTVYGFSTENWKRNKSEVEYLMELFESFAKSKLNEFNELGIKLNLIGEMEKLPKSLQSTLEEDIAATRNNTKMIVNLGLNYGGRDEIARAIRKILDLGLNPEDITEELINSNLDTAGLPDPDLIIRTSGEQRLSNFLPWQSSYSELYFPKILWPDFDEEQLDIAIKIFQQRQRRLGK